MNKLGVANLTAGLLEKGTKNRTVSELEDALAQLGASVFVFATKNNISASRFTSSSL